MQLLIASTSTVFGKPYLSYLQQETIAHFTGMQRILFIPFARAGGLSHEAYTQKAAAIFNSWGFDMRGANEFPTPQEAINWARGVFIGGGNTFLLLRTIYHDGWFLPLQQAVLQGLPYMGTSAGANICGRSIGTTNDMPIVLPPSLDAMNWVPFNFNVHYLDPLPESMHMGETRETRIAEFHQFNPQPVLGLREGSFLEVIDQNVRLGGPHTARLFRAGLPPAELEAGELDLHLQREKFPGW